MKTSFFYAFILLIVFFGLSGFANEALYGKCKGCHGADGSKKAYGVANPLKGQSQEDIINKLNGYKNGTYGGAQKNIMANQVKNLSDTDIKSLAEYISKF
ncbi:MAG: cytochrome c [Deferribacteres bacterium]|jgi:cytochrome c|nr:cytochrome c class [Deferribacteraceae bacterium]MDK2793053.1 cytochrome c [Deferribacteres bacterium]